MEVLDILKKFFAGNKFRLWTWLILVIIPWTLFFLLRILVSWMPELRHVFGPFVLIFFSFYFLLPCLLFGEPHFLMGIGAGPNDFIGVILGFIFYVILASVISLLSMLTQRKSLK